MVYQGDFQLETPGSYFNASYGTVPQEVHAYQAALQHECERNPYRWFTRTYRDKLMMVRERMAKVLRCRREDLVFVDNTSSGANTVFTACAGAGSEPGTILVLDVAYSLVRNLADRAARDHGHVVEVVPLEVGDPDALPVAVACAIDACEEAGRPVRLACVDHIVSCPGMVLPVEDVARVCDARGVPLLVDAAHAIGQLVVDLDRLGEAGVRYWVSDCHKWCFSPKGSAVLWARADAQANLRPTIDCAVIGTDAQVIGTDGTDDADSNNDFEKRFSYLGTKDYTPWLSTTAALDFVERRAGGYDALTRRNRALAVWAQRVLCDIIGTTPVIDDAHTAAMANVPLPHTVRTPACADALVRRLRDTRSIDVVVYEHPSNSGRFHVRACMQIFLDEMDVSRLAEALVYSLQRRDRR